MQAKSITTAILSVAAFAAITVAAPSYAAEPAGSNVRSAISGAVGDSSPDLKATIRGNNVYLSGWAHNSADVSKAISAASRVDGVKRVYNGGVRTWSSRNDI